jgi:hypothetical protein
VGAKSVWDESAAGHIDCLLRIKQTRIGIEHKVIRLPRKRSIHPSGSLYDLGQITADYIRLRDAAGLSGGFCLLIVHGPLVRDSQSSMAVHRHLHNMLFIDYCVSAHSGELADKAVSYRRRQVEAIFELGINQPYFASSRRESDFCVLSSRGDLAVVGIYAREPSRRRE